jgi:predicted AlkP superfamily phosphohydrolase/phosphomutase
MPDKVLIIGLDGADWRILQPYIDDGLMPNLAHMVETGVSGPLRSTIPTNSSVAWSTFMTGRNPGKHAVYDFMRRSSDNPLLMVGVNSQSLRSETWFDVLGRHGRKVGAINVPVTYPPFPVSGFMLGGMFVHEGQPYTFPESLANELDDHVGGFPVNCIRWRFMLGKLEELLDEAIAVTQQRARVLEYLIDHKDWDVLIQVFVGTDRLQHPLMHVLDPGHPRYDDELARRLRPKLRTFFQLTDDMLGRSRQQIGQDAVLMIISDHGFQSVHRAIYVREILARNGLLRTQDRAVLPWSIQRRLRTLGQIVKRAMPGVFPDDGRQVGAHMEMAGLAWSRTQAYVTTRTSQGVYVNLAGREPRGIVSPGADYERLLDDVQEVLLDERDPSNGQRVIESVMRGEELYSGPWADLAPDLMFIPAAGYAAAGGAKSHLGSFEWRTGDHGLDGIFVASGPGLKRREKISGAGLIDVAPSVLYLAGMPIPQDMDGQVLDLFSDRRLTTDPPVYEQGTTMHGGSDYVYTSEEERQVEEQLRSLGYL